MLKTQKSRLVALSTAAVITTMALIPSAPAHAADSKSYKYGAIGLGVLGAVLLSKGKTVEGAAALGGGYLAYKKSGRDRNEELRDERRADRRNDRWDRNDYDNDRYRRNSDWNDTNRRNDDCDDRDSDSRRDNGNHYGQYKNGKNGRSAKNYKWGR